MNIICKRITLSHLGPSLPYEEQLQPPARRALPASASPVLRSKAWRKKYFSKLTYQGKGAETLSTAVGLEGTMGLFVFFFVNYLSVENSRRK